MMFERTRNWNRHQWVGARDGPGSIWQETEPEAPAWNASEMIADFPGQARRPVQVAVSPDGQPHGFSGFGHNPSGGRRWASRGMLRGITPPAAPRPAV